MAPFHVRSKVCNALIHVQSKYADFAPQLDESNADCAMHMEGSHVDFPPHMEQKQSFRDQKKMPFLPILKYNFFKPHI